MRGHLLRHPAGGQLQTVCRDQGLNRWSLRLRVGNNTCDEAFNGTTAFHFCQRRVVSECWNIDNRVQPGNTQVSGTYCCDLRQ